jgi:hypothetical protein
MSLQARRLEHDQWQAYLVSEAAKAAGKWLEQRGNLGRPIASLSKRELEDMCHAAILRWIQIASHRLAERPEEREQWGWIMMG